MKFSGHALERIRRREIPFELVEEALREPDEIVEGKYGRKIYQKLIEGKLLRVVVEGDVVITVYLTSKVSKYYRGGGRK